MYLLTQSTLIITQIVYLINCQGQKYDYALKVPTNLCTGETLSVEGDDAKNLNFTWAVKLKSLKTCQTQRCTLMAWNTIRELEKYLQTESANSQSVNLNNTAATDIEYLFEVTINDKKGVLVETKQFTSECVRKAAAAADASPTKSSAEAVEAEEMEAQVMAPFSLKLLGSNITYPDLVYILNAQVANCAPNCNYYFKWEIFGPPNLLTSVAIKGSEFRVSDIFNKIEKYTIKCSALNQTNDVPIGSACQNVQVLERDLILQLSVSTLVVGLNKPFKLAAFLKDANRNGNDPDITWECKTEKGEGCSDFKPSNSNFIDVPGLSAVNSYVFTIIASKGNLIKRSSCDVKVVESTEIKLDVDIVEYPVDPTKKIEISVYVSNLITGCTLLWSPINQPESQLINPGVIIGNLNKLLNVTVSEDEFLNDIDEFSTNTLNMDFNLKIPIPSETWEGLVQNFSYIFRLNVTCPHGEEVDDSKNESIEPTYMFKFLSVYVDVKVHTGIVPVIQALDVTPKEGVALKTQFNLMVVENVTLDRPMLYRFGYFLNNQIIFIADLMDVTNTSSILPYLDDGVKTVLVGCNSYSVCAQVFGPVVVTKLPTITEDEHMAIMEDSRQLMSREEYYKAFTYFMSILQTYRSIGDANLVQTTESALSNLTSQEIKRLLMLSADGNKDWSFPASELIKNVGLLLNDLPSSTILLNNVVTIRNELARAKNMKLVDASQKVRIKRMVRFKRNVEKMSLDEVKDALSISELIITTSNSKSKIEEEKKQLLQQIDKYMSGLCVTLYQRSQNMNLELKTLTLSVEKFNPNFADKYFHILYPENSWKINGRIKIANCSLKSSDSKLCLGKAAFKNYFHNKKVVYMAKIYSTQNGDEINEESACTYTLVLPVSEKISNKEAKCSLWRKRWSQTHCKTLQSSTKAIQCTCSKLGFYTLEYTSKPKTTSAAPETTVSPTLATEIISGQITDQTFDLITKELTTIALTGTSQVSPFEDFLTPKATTEFTSPISSETIESDVELLTNNETEITHNSLSEDNNQVVLYFVIGFSLVGILVLAFGIRRLLKDDKEIFEVSTKYALLSDEHLLHDVPIL